MINNFGWDFAAANSDNNAKLHPKLASRDDKVLTDARKQPREIKIVHKHVHLVDGKIGKQPQQSQKVANSTTGPVNSTSDEKAALELIETIKNSNNKIVEIIARLQSEADKKRELVRKIREASNSGTIKQSAKDIKTNKSKQEANKAQLQNQVGKANDLEKKANEELSRKVNELSNLKSTIVQHQSAIKSLKSSVVSLTKGQNATTKAVANKNQQAIKEAQTKIAEYKGLYEQEKRKYNAKVTDYNNLKNTFNQHKNTVCSAKTEIALRGSTEEKQAVKTDLDSAKKTAEQKLVSQTKKVQTKQQRLNALKKQLAALEAQLKKIDLELKSLSKVETFGNSNTTKINSLKEQRNKIVTEINRIRAEIIKMQGALAVDIKDTKEQQAKLKEVKIQQAKVESSISNKIGIAKIKPSKTEVQAAMAVRQGTKEVIKTKPLAATKPEAVAAAKAVSVATKPAVEAKAKVIPEKGAALVAKPVAVTRVEAKPAAATTATSKPSHNNTQGHDWLHQHLVDKHGYKPKPTSHRHTGGQEYNTEGGKGTYKYDFTHTHANDKAGHTHEVGPDGKPKLAKIEAPKVEAAKVEAIANKVKPEDAKAAAATILKAKPADAKAVAAALNEAKPDDAKAAVAALAKGKPQDANKVAIALIEANKKKNAEEKAAALKVLNDPNASEADKAKARVALEAANKKEIALNAQLVAKKKAAEAAAKAARAAALAKYKNGSIVRLKSSYAKFIGLDKDGRNVKAGTEKENTALVITRITSIADNAIALYNRETKRFVRARNNRRRIDQSGVKSEDYMEVPKNPLLVFYIEPQANGGVAFRTHHDTYLQMDKKFKVRQSGFVPKGKALPTKWTREVFIPIHLGRMEQKVDMSMFENALIRIKTNTGSYVTAHENSGHVVQRTAHTNGIWKSTLLTKYGYNCIALTSPSTKRLLRAHRNKREIDQSGIEREDGSIPEHWDWVRFFIEKQDNGSYSLRTNHGTYMTTPSDSSFLAQKIADKVGGQRVVGEQFSIIFEQKAQKEVPQEAKPVSVEGRVGIRMPTEGNRYPFMDKFVNGAVIRLVSGAGAFANIAKNGKLGTSKDEIGSTYIVKTLEKQGGNMIALYNKDSKTFLASDSDRKTIKQTKKSKTYNKPVGEQYELAVNQVAHGYTFKTKQGTYLQADGSVLNQSEVEQTGRPLSKGSVWNIQVIGRVIQRIKVKKFKYSQIIRIQTMDGKFLSMDKDGSNTTKEDKESEYNLFDIIFLEKHGYNCMAFYNKKTKRFLRAHRNKTTFSQTGIPDNYQKVPDTWDWIRFYVEKQDGGFYAIRTNQATYLSSGTTSETKQSAPGKLGGQRPREEQLTLVLKTEPVVPEQATNPLPANWKTGSKLRIKTWRNSYISVAKDGSSKQGGAGAYETFIVKLLPQYGSNCVALYGYHKKYLRAHADKKRMDQSGTVPNHNAFPSGWQWERFFVEELKDGKFALRTFHDTYVRANPSGAMDQSKVVKKGVTLDKMKNSNINEGFTGKGEDYRGIQNKTVSGKTCMNWTKQDPHKHENTPDKKAQFGVGDHNFCRNPDGNKEIWCYTTDKNKRWEACKPIPETLTGKGEDYRGVQNKTISGKTCMNWTKQDPHKHKNTPDKKAKFGVGDHNFCRNPDGNKEIWCYTTDKNKRWEACKPKCSEQLSGKGEDYRGCQDKTISGKLCQKWDKDTPHKRNDQTKDAYKKKTFGVGDHRYCRNPDGNKGIWCYTEDKTKRWEDCSPIPSGWEWERFSPIWLYVPGTQTTPVGKPIGHYVGGDYKNDKNWANKSNKAKPAVQWRGNAAVNSYKNGSISFKAIRFEKDDGVRFPPEMSAKAYTVVVVARNRRNNGRVIDGTNNNVLLGWWGNRVGVVHQGRWQSWRDGAWAFEKKNQQQEYRNSWHVVAATNNAKIYLDGKNVTSYLAGGKTPAQWTINFGQTLKNEWVQCDVAEILFYDVQLTHDQLKMESERLTTKYGIRYDGPPMIVEKLQKAIIDGSPVGHFTAESFNTNYNWVNIVGGKPNITEFVGYPKIQGHKNRNKTFKSVFFNRFSGCRLAKEFISENFSLIVVGRNRRRGGRVIDGTTNNFLHGWWGNKTGVFHQGHWISTPHNKGDNTKWHIMSGTNNGDVWYDGLKVTKWKRRASRNPRQISVNWGQFWSGEWVECDIAEMIIYNRNLVDKEADTIHRKLLEKYDIQSMMDIPAIMSQLKNGTKLRLKSHRGTYLQMHSNGAHVKQGGAGLWEEFEVKRAPRVGADYVALFGYHGRYLSAHGNKKSLVQSGRVANGRFNDFFKHSHGRYWELFKVEDVGKGQIAFRTMHNTYVRAHNNGWGDQSAVTGNKKLPSGWKWERFNIQFLEPTYMGIYFRDGAKIRIRTWKQNWAIKVLANGKIKHADKSSGDANSFVFTVKRLQQFGKNCIALYSDGTKKFVGMSPQGKFYLSPKRKDYNDFPLGWAWQRFWIEETETKGKYAIRTYHDRYIYAHANTWIYGTHPHHKAKIVKSNGGWAGFTFERLGGVIMNKFTNGAIFRLKTWRGNYMQLRNNNQAWQGGAGDWEMFRVKRVPAGGPNCIAIYSWHKTYMWANGDKRRIGSNGAKRKDHNDFPADWYHERFYIEDIGKGQVAFRTHHNTYMRAHSNGRMDQSPFVPRGKAMPSNWKWERFTPIFPKEIKGQYVHFQSSPGQHLHMREVRVWDFNQNVAYKKPVKGSADAHGGHRHFIVDGRLPTRWPNSNHTRDVNGWIQVDLKKEHVISKIDVWNRPDCCKGRLGGAVMTIKDKSGKKVWSTKLFPDYHMYFRPGTPKWDPTTAFTNGRKISLYTICNRTVYCHSRWNWVRQHPRYFGWSTFTVKTLPKYGKNCIALFNNAHKRFIKAEGNKRNITQSPRRGHFNDFPMGWQWERLWVENVGNGRVAFRTIHNTYIKAAGCDWLGQSPVRPKGQTIHPTWEAERFIIHWR